MSAQQKPESGLKPQHTGQARQTFDAQAELQAAISAHQQGRQEEAEQKYRRVLAASPANTIALNNLGVLLETMQHPAQAETCYRQALAADPANVDAHCNLSLLLQDDGRAGEAEEHYRAVLALQPDCVQALNKLGQLLLKKAQKESLPQAEALLRAALKVQPGHAEAHANLGVALYNTQQDDKLPEAQEHYREALRLKPDYPEAHNNLGVLLQKAQKLHEAEAHYREAIRIKPDYRDARGNLSNVLHMMQRYDEALVYARELLRTRPDDLDMMRALAYLLRDVGQFEEAEQLLRDALQREPGRIPDLFNLSLVLLAQGKWQEGWSLYEYRYGESEHWGAEAGWHKRPVLPAPEWQGGESLAGKSLVVWPEQGLGDVVQFARYLPLLKARGVTKLTMVCPEPLLRLIGAIEGVDACVPFSEVRQLPAHDYACFLLSLPWIFGTTLQTVPANVPYIKVPDERMAHWKATLPDDDAEGKAGAVKKLRVGLVWAGDPRPDMPHANAIDRRRSMTAKAFVPLLQTPGVTFISLQKGKTTRTQIEDIAQELRPFDPMSDVQDFADTAAIISNLDLVISVDTSVAHVAGALNKPVWILSRFDACWRWLGDRKDSPWYPCARIFRQQTPGRWEEVLEEVCTGLETAVRRHHG
jgi:tetratricopeptide (TPR) repeat protein